MRSCKLYISIYGTLRLRKWNHYAMIYYIFTRWWYSLPGWMDLGDDTEKFSVQLFH